MPASKRVEAPCTIKQQKMVCKVFIRSSARARTPTKKLEEAAIMEDNHRESPWGSLATKRKHSSFVMPKADLEYDSSSEDSEAEDVADVADLVEVVDAANVVASVAPPPTKLPRTRLTDGEDKKKGKRSPPKLDLPPSGRARSSSTTSTVPFNPASCTTPTTSSTPTSTRSTTPLRCSSRVPPPTPPTTLRTSSFAPITSLTSPTPTTPNRRLGRDSSVPKTFSEVKTRVAAALDLSYVPDRMPCRQEQRDAITGFLQSCLDNHKGGSVYISGTPGTGKTAIVTEIVRSLKSQRKIDVMGAAASQWVNAMVVSDVRSLYLSIVGMAGGELSSFQGAGVDLAAVASEAERLLLRVNGPMCVLVVDELDKMSNGRHREFLNKLFMLASLPGSRFILVGIANALDLTSSRLLPELASIGCSPAHITFDRYGPKEIEDILRHRIAIGAAGSDVKLFSDFAINFCATRAAAMSGDVRGALQACRNCVMNLNEESNGNGNGSASGDSVDGSSVSSPSPVSLLRSASCSSSSEVGIMELSAMLPSTSGGSKLNCISTIPTHQQLVLCAMALKFRGAKKEASAEELLKEYAQLCRQKGIPSLSTSEFSNMLDLLSDYSLVHVSKDSRINMRKRVQLLVDEADVKSVLKTVPFFVTILEQ